VRLAAREYLCPLHTLEKRYNYFMKKEQIPLVVSEGWTDYELLDSGLEMKLERFGKYILARPDTKALWKPSLPASIWRKADATYRRSSDGGGKWHFNTRLPEKWNVSWKHLTFAAQPSGFKHTGIFPEQASVWQDIIDTITAAKRPVNVLNLFAYTGGCTLAAASAGASVTHLDAAKEIITWARENVTLSGLESKPIRWIPDDAITFVKREIKRGNKYDMIIMDPPKFGRGTTSQVWKFEEHLPHLIELCKQILTPDPLMVFVNAYAVSFSSRSLHNIVRHTLSNGTVTSGELAIRQKDGLILPCSIYAKWSAQ
jgi:23S rRNA (cytosine1962-C5)-methyltransferase